MNVASLNRGAGPWIALLIAASVLIPHAWRYLPIFDDDAFISLRYAQRLLDGEGLTWTDGPRVEGYSNLLWILLIAAVGGFGVELVTSARVLGVTLMIGAMSAVLWSTPWDKRRAVPLTLGLLLFPLAIPIAVWSIAGLEQPLVACLLAWAVVLIRSNASDDTVRSGRTVLSSVLLGLLCLTRPDSPLLVFAVVLGAMIAEGFSRNSLKSALIASVGPIVAITGQQIFRLTYYGQWLPNPALVKIARSMRRLDTGLDYVIDGLMALWPVVILAAVALCYCLTHHALRRRQYPLILIFVLWSGYLVLIGGDIFAAWRHVVPLVVVLALVTTDAACDAWQRFNLRGRRAMLATIVLAALGGAFWTQSHDERNLRALSQQSEWDGRTVGLMLRRTFGDAAPLIAVDAAGSVPYWSRLPALDMLGLNDAHIPFRPPPDFGKGFIGHELGDGRYVLDRRPDLILFRGPAGSKNAVYRSGLQLQALPEFRREYSLVKFESRPPESFQSLIWVRRTSPKIGIRAGPDSFVIPAYLMCGNPQTVAEEVEAGQFTITVSSECPAIVERLAIPAGRWVLQVQPPSALYAIVESDGIVHADGPLPLNVTVPATALTGIRIELRAESPRSIIGLVISQETRSQSSSAGHSDAFR